jgi:hypothetical protein
MKLWSNQTLNLSFSLPHTKKIFLKLNLHTYAYINKTIYQANLKGNFTFALYKTTSTQNILFDQAQENLMLFIINEI